MTTKDRETSVSVTLSLRDWIVIGSVFVGLVAWGVRLETRIDAAEKEQVDQMKQIEKLENRIDRMGRRWGSTPSTNEERH